VGCNTHVHGSNVRNLSVELSLFQTSKNVMSFLLSHIFSLQQNWRTRVWNRFCPEVVGQRKWLTQCIHM
jgi:hypothetical protein